MLLIALKMGHTVTEERLLEDVETFGGGRQVFELAEIESLT